jgi:hypothetical protein
MGTQHLTPCRGALVCQQRLRSPHLAAQFGVGVVYIRTTIVPGDQTLFHLFEAPSANAVREAAIAAGLESERVVEVVEAAPP